jgi:predicted kinase
LIHLNPDHYLETGDGRIFTPERNTAAWEQLYLDLDEALQNGGGLVTLFVVLGVQGSGKSTWIDKNKAQLGDSAIFVDAALPGARHRARLLTLAGITGTPVTAVWINVPLAVALNRNSGRPPDKQVSEEVIRYVFSNFEPPTIDEGFSEIHVIKENFF